jgi:hypothetical protein
MRSAARGVISSSLAFIPADISGREMTSSINPVSFDEASPPYQSAFHHLSCQRHPIMFLHAEFCGGNDAAENGQQLAIAMAAAIDGNSFHAEIEAGQMHRRRQSGLSPDRGCQKPTKPRRVLQDRQYIPGIKDDHRCSTGGRFSVRRSTRQRRDARPHPNRDHRSADPLPVVALPLIPRFVPFGVDKRHSLPLNARRRPRSFDGI